MKKSYKLALIISSILVACTAVGGYVTYKVRLPTVYGEKCTNYQKLGIRFDENNCIKACELKLEESIKAKEQGISEAKKRLEEIQTAQEFLKKDKEDLRVLREERIVKAEAQKGTLSSLDPSRKVHKLLCMCNPLYTKEIERSLKERFPHCSIACSSDILIEIMNEGVTKADAINHLCDYYSINKQDIVAFGDNYNDKEMLESVGMGIAMGNAPDDIKNIAKDVTSTNNQDGIFKALQKLNII